MNKKNIWMMGSLLLLSACSNVPQRPQTESSAAPIVDLRNSGYTQKDSTSATIGTGSGAYLAGDGPGADAPSNLDAIPDAVPKNEPLHRYANRPYSALGKTYTPLTAPGNYKERGIASWYGKKFHGQHTSIGEVYDMYAMTAAHPTLPIPSYARVTNPANGKSVIVRVNDRGPFLHDRIMDLSYVAAYKLGYINNGSAEVEVESLTADSNAPVISAVEVPAISVEAEGGAPAVAETPSLPIETTGKRTGKVFLQLGAFKAKQGAQSFMSKMRAELGDSHKSLTLYQKQGLTRVHLGPYANVDEARNAAARLSSKLGFKPFVSMH